MKVRARFPMIRRLFIEAGSAPVQQRWARLDAVRLPTEISTAPMVEPHCPVVPEQQP